MSSNTLPDLKDIDFAKLAEAIRNTYKSWRDKKGWNKALLNTIGKQLNIDMSKHKARFLCLLMSNETDFTDERDKYLCRVLKVLKEAGAI